MRKHEPGCACKRCSAKSGFPPALLGLCLLLIILMGGALWIFGDRINRRTAATSERPSPIPVINPVPQASSQAKGYGRTPAAPPQPDESHLPEPTPKKTAQRPTRANSRTQTHLETISATELAAAYRHKQEANKRFRRKTLVISGLVESSTNRYVSLKDKNTSAPSVRCNYSHQRYAALAIEPGNPVVVRGIVRGKRFSGRVELDNCIVESR